MKLFTITATPIMNEAQAQEFPGYKGDIEGKILEIYHAQDGWYHHGSNGDTLHITKDNNYLVERV